MNKLTNCCLALLAVVILYSCSSNNSSNGTSNGTKYLAKNIILNANTVNTAYAESLTIDTTTQVPASNVIFESTLDSQVTSSNVQSALEEISLKLPKVLIGTWNITNYNQESSFHEATGKVMINIDGTFNLTAGSFAAIGMGSGTAQDPMCNHTLENQSYQTFTDDLIAFVHYNSSINPPVKNNVIPRLVKLRKNEIIFVGQGGCGMSGLERISVLSRVQ